MSVLKVLDHGYVKLRNLAGPTPRPIDDVMPYSARDEDIPQTARKSFNNMGKTYTYKDEMQLADYLYRNFHSGPFEMIETWWDLKLPIFVDRHMVRHRTWSRDEASGRYTKLSPHFYVPSVEDVMFATPNKKQGGRELNYTDELEVELAEDFISALKGQCEQSYSLYEKYLSRGIAPEQARLFLHVNHYVEWTGKVDLHNLFHFLTLRTHDHAQQESRAYAWAMVNLLKPELPGLMALWEQYETTRTKKDVA